MPMNYFKLFTYFMASLALVLSSCSMQKRVYSKGYTIHWKKKQPSAGTRHQLANAPQPAVQHLGEAAMPAAVAEPATAAAEVHHADKGPVAAAAVTAPGKATASTPAFETKLDRVETRSDGTQLMVKEPKQAQKQAARGKRAGEGGKSQIVALLLCIFLGWLGIHRFYLGYTGMGLLYLFTFGILGIGWIIDIILLIIPNGLTPKNKTSYDE